MGWYLRKAFCLGPLRLNLSERGVGASIGVKDDRLRSTRGPRLVRSFRLAGAAGLANAARAPNRSAGLAVVETSGAVEVRSVGSGETEEGEICWASVERGGRSARHGSERSRTDQRVSLSCRGERVGMRGGIGWFADRTVNETRSDGTPRWAKFTPFWATIDEKTGDDDKLGT